MSDEPTTIDWGYILHETEGHTPYGPEWFMLKPGRHHEGSGGKYRNILNGCYIEMYLTDERWEDDEEREALANQALICAAPKFRDEVIRLREEVKRLRRADETTSKYLSFALDLLTDEQDCEYTHFVGGLCTHDCCPEREEE